MNYAPHIFSQQSYNILNALQVCDSFYEREREYDSYCLNNPLKYVDPSGELLVFAGNQATLSRNQLQAFTNLALSWDANTGMISATGEVKSANDRMLLNIINNQKITVNITATDANIGNPYGGAFWGNKVSFNTDGNSTNILDNPLMHFLNIKEVSTDQSVNPLKNYILDSFEGQRGQTLFHEITESFNGGVLSMIFGKSALKAQEGNATYKTIYDPAHNSAYPHPVLDEVKLKEFDRIQKTINEVKNQLEKYKVW